MVRSNMGTVSLMLDDQCFERSKHNNYNYINVNILFNKPYQSTAKTQIILQIYTDLVLLLQSS